MNSKKTLLFFSLAIAFSACNNLEKHHNELADTLINNQNTQTHIILTEDSSLTELQKFKNQYPNEIDLFNNPLLKERLQNLLGSEYVSFKKYWQTETPIVIEDNVLSTTGCEQHNCAANQYILFVDIAHNNINVYHLSADIKSFLEKGPISLPAGLAKEFETITDNTYSLK